MELNINQEHLFILPLPTNKTIPQSTNNQPIALNSKFIIEEISHYLFAN